MLEEHEASDTQILNQKRVVVEEKQKLQKLFAIAEPKEQVSLLKLSEKKVEEAIAAFNKSLELLRQKKSKINKLHA
jgi:hypothetical protein